jgi:hypothetical protein
VRESRTPGSARGGRGNPVPYRYRPPDRVVAGSVNDLQFHDLLFQQLQRPPLATLRRFGTGQGNQLRFGGAVKDARSGRGWGMLADKHGIEAFFHQLLAGPSNGVDAGIEGGGDFAVPPSFASLRGISLQQNACLGQLPGRVLTGTYQRVEPFPLLIAEFHHVSLLGNLFRGHEASPSLRSERVRDLLQNQ